MCCASGVGVAQAPTRDNWSPRIILKVPVVKYYPKPSDSYDRMIAVGITVTVNTVNNAGLSLPERCQLMYGAHCTEGCVSGCWHKQHELLGTSTA